MKKILSLLLLGLASFGTVNAQEDGVYVLNADTYIAEGSTDNEFNFPDGFQVISNNRGWKTPFFNATTHPDLAEGVDKNINFKLNSSNLYIKIPEGKKAYRIVIYGFSQGDNWCYLAAWGAGEKTLTEGANTYPGFEWVDPLQGGVKDNSKIVNEATYPIDPCHGRDINGIQSKTKDVNTNVVADLDFNDMPYEGEFPFFGSGNNQYRLSFKVYTKPTSGINNVEVEKKGNNIRYNIAGQRVDNNYKGIVIENGRKMIVK